MIKLIYTILGALIVMILIITPPVQAFQFDYKELSGFVDTTISSGVLFRLENKDHALIGRANGGTSPNVSSDDGDRNYAKGALVSATSKMTNDVGIKYRSYDVFVRGSYFYDPINLHKNNLTEKERQLAGRGGKLLDAYIQGRYEPLGKKLDVRVGRQVLNWGESMFIPGGMIVTNSVDLTRLRLPGSEVKEAYLPSPMIYDSIQLTDQLTFEKYYKFRWERSYSDVCGTFFSTDDASCEGGTGKVTSGFGAYAEGTSGAVINRLSNRNPSNHGQYGAALRYLVPQLNSTELGLYYINYHNHLPSPVIVSTTPGNMPSYYFKYLENLQVYGLSASTEMFGLAFQGEYTYQPRVPLMIESNVSFAAAQYVSSRQMKAVTGPGQLVNGYRMMPVSQLQGAVSKSFGHQNPFFADDWNFAVEAAMVYVSHFPRKQDLLFEGPGTNLAPFSGVGSPGLETTGWANRFSWGYVVGTSWTYEQVIKQFDMTPRVAFSHNVEGTTPSPLSQFLSRRMSVTVGLTTKYKDDWSVDVSYTNFSHAGFRNLLVDRDFASVTVKRWF